MPIFWKKKKSSDLDPFNPFPLNIDFDSKMFEDMEKQVEEMMRAFSNPENIRRMQESQGKPIVSGFSIKMGPEGKIDVEQFGNVVPRGQNAEIKNEREPLVDVIDKDKEITVIAELPGVDKKEIKLKVIGEKNVLDINVPGKFSKKVKLPAKVKQALAKANYKNGVLEVNLTKEKARKEEGIPVE
jgi:HSP20 family protein